MQIWRLIAHHENAELAIDLSRNNNRISVGWGAIGDLSEMDISNPPDVTALIKQIYPALNNAHLGGPSLWNFFNNVEIGDLVILSTGRRRLLVMKVIGEYAWLEENPDLNDYQHIREAEETEYDPEEVWREAGARPANGHNIRWTLIQCEEALTRL